jgi:Radical SAM superfamily
MRRFPLRLTLDLKRVRAAQKLFGPARRPLALRLDLAQFPAPAEPSSGNSGAAASSSNSSREAQVLSTVQRSAAPVVWIGVDTPLHYPDVASIARGILNLGRSVFIEMDGVLLRRRIHEFRPVSGLYLVLPLHGLESAHDSRTGRPGNFKATLESMRTAMLSGFHVCVETGIFADTDPNELRALAQLLAKLDVDGWIQSPSHDLTAQISREKLEAACALIPSRRWRIFSKLLNSTPGEMSPRPAKQNVVKRTENEIAGPEEGLRAL